MPFGSYQPENLEGLTQPDAATVAPAMSGPMGKLFATIKTGENKGNVYQTPDGKFYLRSLMPFAPNEQYTGGMKLLNTDAAGIKQLVQQAAQQRAADLDGRGGFDKFMDTYADNLSVTGPLSVIGGGLAYGALAGAGGAGAGLDSLGAWEAGMSGGAPAGATGGAGALAGTPYAGMAGTAGGLASTVAPSLPTGTLPGSGVTDEMLITGQNAANTGTLGTMAEGALGTGATAAGAAGNSSIWDSIAKALGVTTTAVGTTGLKDIIGGLVSGYGASNTADKYAEAMKYAADKADPFSSQRGLYQTLFNSMNGVGGAPATTDPFNTPWMQNLTNTTVDNTAQRLSSKYGGDVSSLGVKNKITQQVNAANTPIAMDYLKTMGNAAGMNIQPNAGQILATGAGNSAGLDTKTWGNYGVAANGALDWLFKNNNNNSNTTSGSGWSI